MYNLNCIIVIIFNCICVYKWGYTLVYYKSQNREPKELTLKFNLA